MGQLNRHLRAGHPLLRVVSLEEDAAARAVKQEAEAVLGPGLRTWEWDAALGLRPARTGAETLEAVLEAAAAEPGPALFLLRDLHRFWSGPALLRRLRGIPAAVGRRPVRVVLLTPPAELPIDLLHEVPSASFAVPAHEELLRLVEEELAATRQPAALPARLAASALRGLTALEARLALRRVLATGPLDELALARLFEDKAARIEVAGLEFFPPDVSFDDVGGLGALKEWVAKRAAVFRGEVELAGYQPRGLLVTGVSGCGKSFSIKALSRVLAAPLFRLDMARVFASRDPEFAYTRAMEGVEAMAPCVLWLDEIEDALSLGTQDTGAARRITGSFLTWLQEHGPGIFVAATANRIEYLPAELLRRGRFDQIFFVDLPDEEERKRIWHVHLARRRQNPALFDLVVLSSSTAGWSGAEIEAAVQAAEVEAQNDGVPLQREHLFLAIGRTVPLSVTMKEQIRKVREWAHDRALSASGKKL